MSARPLQPVQVVVLSQVLAADVNVGFEEIVNTQVGWHVWGWGWVVVRWGWGAGGPVLQINMSRSHPETHP